jgi:hypothetical protein
MEDVKKVYLDALKISIICYSESYMIFQKHAMMNNNNIDND